MRINDIGARACFIAFLLVANVGDRAAALPSIDIVDVDLNPLIDASAPYKVRFAVNVPHEVSLGRQGQWQDSGGTSTWTYSARIATAVSLSFHASTIQLPPSAVLEVTGARSSVSYRARDARLGQLW